ncbi:MAG: hypothetical protein FIB08_03525 [Candidatus Methanoperedens sp.]|nr:hypothetical protein [Candidatus Methanoperedens sp.]
MKYKAKMKMDRFKVRSLNELKLSIAERPDLKRKLKEDLKGTLESEGIVINEEFKQEISDQWRLLIRNDIRKIMDKQPGEKKPLYTMVRKGEPLKLKVKIDKTTGKKIITPMVKT